MNPLKELLAQGQSIWLDYMRRNLIRTGELKRLVDEDGIRGVTSNPTIFEKAMAGSTDYDDAIRAILAREPKIDVGSLYERLAVEDRLLREHAILEQDDAGQRHLLAFATGLQRRVGPQPLGRFQRPTLGIRIGA